MPNPPQPSPSKGKGFTLRPLPEEAHDQVIETEAPTCSREPFDNLGELPHGYGVDTIFLIAQEPHWLFTYWDIDIARHPGGAAFLRYHRADGTLEGEIEVPFETRNWYVPVPLAGTEYFVEIGFYRGSTWNLIARSLSVLTPPEGLATSEAFDYATVPFHLSFQRMLDHLESARDAGEDLLTVVARLQQNGDFFAFGIAALPELLTTDQRALLRALLGADLLEELASSGQSSGEIEARIRTHLEEILSSGGASEALSSLGAFGDTSSLFSAGHAFGSEALSPTLSFSSESSLGSWSLAAISSWAAGAIAGWSGSASELTSWGAAESVGTSGETSWTATAFASTSWEQAAAASWTQAGLSSWLQSGESSGSGLTSSSWLQAVQSSWLQGVQSSWAAAALSSWTSAEVSSWFSAAATTSWSGASENLDSFGASTRDFFMHVNAEVIFYGGTDPRARVTIDGQPVTLAADGTFRYHFLFPNADYEIPVVAESPDGVETRSATLRFTRSTGKVGLVTDTPQPPLGAPMGEKVS